MLATSRLNTTPLALLCALLTLTSNRTIADDAPLTPAQISELISVTPHQPSDNNRQLNWQQWGEAEASAQSVVDAPVPDWGLLPDAPPDDNTLSATLAERDGNRLTSGPAFGVQGEVYRVKRLSLGRRQEGEASWYGPGFNGRKTASGDTFNMHVLSAAHRTLPLPSYVRVTNLANGKTVIVKVNDRGPYHSNRIIDLSYAAARMLDMQGTSRVALEPVAGEEKVGKDRAGVSLGSDTAYQVMLGNYTDTNAAQLLQARLMKRLPPGIPVTLRTTLSPVVAHRVEVGPLASPTEVQVLIRSILASRMGFADEPLRIKPGKAY